jgi:hypothetical protein
MFTLGRYAHFFTAYGMHVYPREPDPVCCSPNRFQRTMLPTLLSAVRSHPNPPGLMV